MHRILKNTRYIRITEDTCRICLRETPLGKKVLKSFAEEIHDLPEPQTLGSIYEACTGYRTNVGPQNICIVCEGSLKQLYLFRLEIDNSEDVLRVFEESNQVAGTKEESYGEAEIQIINDEEDEFPELDDVDDENGQNDGLEYHEVNVEMENDDALPDENMEEERLDDEQFAAAVVNDVIECGICQAQFSSQSQMKLHLKVHLKPRIKKEVVLPQKKDKDSEFIGVKEENVDEENHLPPSSNPKECPYCQKVFSSSSHCEQHKKIHLGIKEFQCHECTKWFRTMSQLKSHLSSHYEERNFKCNTCHKKFKTRKTLKGHEEIHSKDIKFLCTFCEAGYTNKTALRVHMLRKHKIVKDDGSQ